MIKYNQFVAFELRLTNINAIKSFEEDKIKRMFWFSKIWLMWKTI